MLGKAIEDYAQQQSCGEQYKRTVAKYHERFKEHVGGTSVDIGLITKDQVTIGRVDIWDSNEGFEGITEIWAYQNIPAGGG